MLKEEWKDLPVKEGIKGITNALGQHMLAQNMQGLLNNKRTDICTWNFQRVMMTFLFN